MAIGMKRQKIYLDPKTCFDLWIETGSIHSVAKVLGSRGISNPFTGKNPTAMGCWNSAWMWILSNLPEARTKITDSWKAEGEVLTEEIWNSMVYKKAKYIYNRKRFLKFLGEHPELTRYQNVQS